MCGIVLLSWSSTVKSTVLTDSVASSYCTVIGFVRRKEINSLIFFAIVFSIVR